MALLLVLAKTAGWVMTGSIALLASAVDALVDTGASLVTLLGVRYAQRPPDRDHRFGHGKGEAVAAFTQATFLAGAAAVLAFQSLQRLVSPTPLDALEFGVALIAGSLVVATGLVAMQTWVVRRTGSTAIAADRAHYLHRHRAQRRRACGARRDQGHRMDAGRSGVRARHLRLHAPGTPTPSRAQALEQLLDQELPREERRRIKEAVRACAGVRNIHDLRTRFSGDRTFVEYHLEVDPGLTVDVGHAIGDATEDAVRRLLPGKVEATAHLEPHGIARRAAGRRGRRKILNLDQRAGHERERARRRPRS